MLLQRHVMSLGTTCSVTQRNELLDRRRKLEARITAYEHRISVIINPDDWFTPEQERITLPSALAPGEIERLSLKSIAVIEAELRKGQITDALQGLRLALGEKSLCFRTQVRNADSQRTTHRAWDNVHKSDAKARKCWYTYRQARNALQHLDVDPEYVATLRDITDDDLRVAGDLTDERRFGQRSDTLPWFWRFGEPVDCNNPRMEECMSSPTA